MDPTQWLSVNGITVVGVLLFIIISGHLEWWYYPRDVKKLEDIIIQKDKQLQEDQEIIFTILQNEDRSTAIQEQMAKLMLENKRLLEETQREVDIAQRLVRAGRGDSK